ncbi:MAG: hypothetical protein JWM40_3088 [Frankiales bacterium]|nr:hypothetical protein [Frankiales bacterium]
MTTDLLDHYARASSWTAEKVAGARDLDLATPCDDWSVRDLLNHMLDTQRYFTASGKGEDASPPGPVPPKLLSDDPAKDFKDGREQLIAVFGHEGVIEKTGPALGIAFADQLLHGWDLARATDQDATMPDGLAEAALGCIHGMFSEEQRKGVFKPEIEVPSSASPEERLLAYTGRPV